MSKTYKMRDLVNWSLTELMNHDHVPITVVCDDGSVEAIIEEVILSWHLWEFHRRYPKMPYLTRHVMSNITITPNTHLKYLGDIQKDCYLFYRQSEYEEMLEYNKLVYKIFNDLYNFSVSELSGYITSLSILDYLDVMDHPDIREANLAIQQNPNPTNQDIAKAYEKITYVLENDKSLIGNSISDAYRHRLVSIGQIWQMVGPRGFVSDIDSHIFKNPIRVGYAEGIHELHDYLVESRTGTTAEIMTGDPMKDSEYLNRLLQLSVSRVKYVRKYDCGSTKTFPMVIDSKTKLKDMHGIYYYNDDTGRQEPIDPNKDTHLIGKTINVRLVFGCKHRERDSVCARCYGDLAYNMHSTDVVGHIAAIEHQSPQTQVTLSYKHHTSSADDYGIYIDDMASKWFYVNRDEYATYMHPDVKLEDWSMRVPHVAMYGFESLRRVDSWLQVSPSRISHLVSVIFTKDDDIEELGVATDDNPVFFTLDALKYLTQTAKVTIHENGDYEFTMDKWDVTKPLFRIPKVKFDSVEYTKMLETFIKGPTTGDRRLKQSTIVDFDHPVAALIELHDMTSIKLNISMSHLQLVILSSMCNDPDNDDYRLPTDREKGKFVPHETLMSNSSPVVAIGYQSQEQIIMSPENYLGKPKPSHLYDHLLLG